MQLSQVFFSEIGLEKIASNNNIIYKKLVCVFINGWIAFLCIINVISIHIRLMEYFYDNSLKFTSIYLYFYANIYFVQILNNHIKFQ